MHTTDLTGRTAIVTGAGAGLGRAEALALAAAGARVIVNDMSDAADAVVAEIADRGGEALAVVGDVGEWRTGQLLVDAAVDTFGALDILLNNAGVLRDAMLFNMTESQWDDVLRVHLKGHAALSRAASAHWRDRSKQAGAPVYGRVINTSSESFLFGTVGQANYAAAKAGIATLTMATAQSMARYGVTANAICPRARTEMTATFFAEKATADGLDILAPERVATFATYLASPAAGEVNGQVFIVYGDMVALMAAPQVEQKFTAASGTFSLGELDEQISTYFRGRSPERTFAARQIAELDTTGVGRSNE